MQLHFRYKLQYFNNFIANCKKCPIHETLNPKMTKAREYTLDHNGQTLLEIISSEQRVN